MAKNIASENIFDGLKGGPAAVQKTGPVQETVSAPVKSVKVAQHTGVSFNELVNQLLEQYCAAVESNRD